MQDDITRILNDARAKVTHAKEYPDEIPVPLGGGLSHNILRDAEATLETAKTTKRQADGLQTQSTDIEEKLKEQSSFFR